MVSLSNSKWNKPHCLCYSVIQWCNHRTCK